MVNNMESSFFKIISYENKMYRVLGSTRFERLKETLVWGPHFSEILHHVTGWLVTDTKVWEQHVGPMFKGQLSILHWTFSHHCPETSRTNHPVMWHRFPENGQLNVTYIHIEIISSFIKHNSRSKSSESIKWIGINMSILTFINVVLQSDEYK